MKLTGKITILKKGEKWVTFRQNVLLWPEFQSKKEAENWIKSVYQYEQAKVKLDEELIKLISKQ